MDEPCSRESSLLTLTASSDKDDFFFAHTEERYFYYENWLYYYSGGIYTNVLFVGYYQYWGVGPIYSEDAFRVLGYSDGRTQKIWTKHGDVSTEVVLTSDHLDWTFESTKTATLDDTGEVVGRVSVHGSFDLTE